MYDLINEIHSRICSIYLYVANECNSTDMVNSNYASIDSINGYYGDSVFVICDAGYGGGGTAHCGLDGQFDVTNIECFRESILISYHLA